MQYTKWSFWSLRERLSFRVLEQNAGISRRQRRFVEVWRNPDDTKRNPEFLYIFTVCETYFSTALFLLNLEYELKLYKLYETTVFLCHRKKMQMFSLDTG